MRTATLVDGRYFCEGPRWHKDRFWFSDFYAGEIATVTVSGEVRTAVSLDTQEQPSGLGWLPDGRLLFVAMLARKVMRVEHDGRIVQHADLSAIASYHCNDMLVDPAGCAYVGNFGFDLDAALTDLGTEGLFTALARDPVSYSAQLAQVNSDGGVYLAASDLLFPNGMVLVDGGRTLVVAQTLASELTAFDRASDGSLSNPRCWASLANEANGFVAPDGIAVDAFGGVWVANALAAEVLRVEEGGAITARVATSNPAFACAIGGPEGRHLLVCTAATSNAQEARAARTGKLEIIEL